MDGRRDRSAGSSRSRASRENRRCPPGVVNTRTRPASLQRRIVAGETPSMRLASERPIQSGSVASDRLKTYSNLSEEHRLAQCSRSPARTPFQPHRADGRDVRHARAMEIAELRGLPPRVASEVVLPVDTTWETARLAWNLAVEQRPVAVVYPESAGDVAGAVRFAAEHGLPVAFNGGGHNAGPIDWGRDTVLLKTERMRGIQIDVARRRGRIGAGGQGKPLAVAAGEDGLAFLAGTSPDVGVVGYALGGGLSWMIRKHGLACNSIVAADVVTADGLQRRGGPAQTT